MWMFYQAYQRVEYGTAACIRTRTRPQVFQQGRTRYQGSFPRAYKLTKVSGTGGEVVPSLLKFRVRVWMPYRTYQKVGYGYGCCTKLIKGSGTDIDVVLCLPKGRVWVWMFYQAYQRVGYSTAACTRTRTLYPTPGISTRPYPVPGYFPEGVPISPKCRVRGEVVPSLPKCRVRVVKLYQAYQSVGYGYESRS